MLRLGNGSVANKWGHDGVPWWHNRSMLHGVYKYWSLYKLSYLSPPSSHIMASLYMIVLIPGSLPLPRLSRCKTLSSPWPLTHGACCCLKPHLSALLHAWHHHMWSGQTFVVLVIKGVSMWDSGNAQIAKKRTGMCIHIVLTIMFFYLNRNGTCIQCAPEPHVIQVRVWFHVTSYPILEKVETTKQKGNIALFRKEVKIW